MASTNRRRTARHSEPHTALQDTLAIRPAIYLRVSTSEQADSGLGMAAQQARCMAMADAKGWPTPVIFADDGLSGTMSRAKRPQLDMLLSAVQAGTINAVIVLDLTRLARDIRLILEYVDLLRTCGATFVSCKESFDTSTAMGNAMLQITAVFAELERNLISERTIAALDERGKLHGYKAGRLPLGYRRDGESILVDSVGAATVRRVFTLRDDDGLTLREIADLLNTEGTPAPKRGGKWQHSAVQTLLANKPIYTGRVAHWPAILQGATA